MYFKTCLSPSKMKVNSQVTISKRFLVIILVALFALSAINTFLIFERTSGPTDTSAVNYDYVVSQDGSGCLLKNMLTGLTTTVPTSLSYAINILMSEGKSVYINPGTYTLTQNVLVSNKINAKIVSDGATITGNGCKIIIRGDNYTASKYATISGLTLINATIRLEDSFTTTISN